MSVAAPRAALGAVVLSTVAANLTLTILAIALKPIAIELDSTVDAAGWLTVAPILVSALVAPASGRASDRFGARVVWIMGSSVLLVSLVLSALAPSMATLIAARVLTGVGGGLAMSSGLAMAAGAYPPEDRGTPMSAIMTASALSPAVGVLLGGPIIELYGFRVLFWAQVPPMLASLLVGVWVLPNVRPVSGVGFDAIGATLAGLSSFSFLLLLNRAPSWGLTSMASIATLTAAVVLLALFVRRERASRSPIVPPAAYRDAATRRALAARAVLYAVYMGSFLVLPLVLMDAGRSLAETALLLSPRPIMMGVFGPIATRVIGRFGLGRVAVGGAAGIALGLGILPFYDPHGPLLPLMVALVSMGTGLGAAQVATATVVTARSKHDDLGAASATITIATAIAGALGMAGLLGLATNPAYGPRVAFIVAATVGAAGVVLSFMLERSLAAQAPGSGRSHASPSSG
jgi:MFS family permease